jgi:predicted methyltransferase
MPTTPVFLFPRAALGRCTLVCVLVAAGFMSSIAPRGAGAQPLDAATGAAIDSALAGAHRSERNKARDPSRHAKATLEFFGLRRDMTVIEIWPGAGWYTEILAPVLRGTGKLYAATYGLNPPFPYQRAELAALLEKFAEYRDVYDEVTLTTLAFPHDLEIAPPGSADLVVTFRNVHNWFDPGYGRQADRLAFIAMYDALRPGGTLGVVDHRWPDAATEDPAAANGYLSEQRVIEYAEAAGFELVDRSDVNRNPRDTHDHPAGVWTLPPDLALGERDRQRYLDIGESDRFTLKFVKRVP